MPILDPITLSKHQHENEIRRRMQQQQQQQQQGANRDRYMLDLQRRTMGATPSGPGDNMHSRNGTGQSQQQPIRPGPPGPGGPQGQGQPRLGPNGQPLPQNIAPSQQQILNAVAAATAANRQGQSTPGGSVRPLPQPNQGQGGPMPQGQQRVMQQMEAQMLAAQMVQARAQQAQNQRAASAGGGTPVSQPGSNLSATPYQGMPDLGELMPNGNGNGEGSHMHAQSSPAMMNANMNNGMHSSPQGRPGQMPMVQAPHLRASSAGSPQMGNSVPNQQMGSALPSQMNQALMTQIAAQLQASGNPATPEAIKAHMARYLHGVSSVVYRWKYR